MNARGRIYLDYAATTPVDPAVWRAMAPYFREKFGNAGSLHSFGQEAIAALDQARERVARAANVDFRGVIFTASATEANNLALRGVAEKALLAGQPRRRPRIIISAIEHESVLETAKDLETRGVEVIYLPVDRRGLVDISGLKKHLDENTVLVSVMYVNNEVGTVEPVQAIAKVIEDLKHSGTSAPLLTPFFHIDASQAFGHFSCDMAGLGADFMTVSSHKLYGPKGAAALIIREAASANKSRRALPRGPVFLPVIFGGGQEFGLRSGTENVPAIVGFGKAVELAMQLRAKESKRLAGLRDYFWREIQRIYPKAAMNGATGRASAPHILNVYFPGWTAQDVLTRLDLAGVAASSGSACRSRAMESSYVIEALGHPKERALSSIRFSLGRPTTKTELWKTLKILKTLLR